LHVANKIVKHALKKAHLFSFGGGSGKKGRGWGIDFGFFGMFSPFS
jgi:hypothetical protein